MSASLCEYLCDSVTVFQINPQGGEANLEFSDSSEFAFVQDKLSVSLQALTGVQDGERPATAADASGSSAVQDKQADSLQVVAVAAVQANAEIPTAAAAASGSGDALQAAADAAAENDAQAWNSSPVLHLGPALLRGVAVQHSTLLLPRPLSRPLSSSPLSSLPSSSLSSVPSSSLP